MTPEEEDDDGWKTYWLSYFAFQEKTLKAQFRKDTDDLDKLWKRHVIDTAAKYGNVETEGNPARRLRGRNRN